MTIHPTLKAKLRALPDKPGCYLMRDRNGRIIYVGKAASLRKRVQSYFREAAVRRGSPKLRSLVNSIADIETIVLHNEAAAILTEGQLIKQYKPRYNVTLRDDKRFLLLRADPSEPLPSFSLVRQARNDGASYFGPYAASAAARTALDFVEKRFGIRKCAPREPDAETYRHCLNDIIRFCSAPCVGRIGRDDYRARFEEACAFLRGRRPGYLEELRATMREAAAQQDYERAAALRDTLLNLERAVRQHARAAPTPRMRQAAAEEGLRALQAALELPGPPHVIEAFDVSNISGTHAVASMVCAVDGLPRNSRYRRFRIRTVTGSDDPAMMAEAVRRRFTDLLEKGAAPPDLVLVDGGITQLRAARAELATLGLATIPTVGLAKRYEEVHLDNGQPPVRLPSDSAALLVLRRLRDEAHRFAITYHRHLRNRHIRNSVLDEVRGVGAARKQRLLAHFGSVRRILNAGPAGIAAVAGIGPALAEEIHARVRERLTGDRQAE
jgi:excinuclease ABC subunit C